MALMYRLILPAILIACSSATARAQEGYPLDGTWRGALSAGADDSKEVVIIMKWDGTTITGLINPGRNPIHFRTAQMLPESWQVRIEAGDPGGEAIRIEGVLSEIGSYRRKITGTWTEAGVAYPFEMRRE